MAKTITREEMVGKIEDGSISEVLKTEAFISFGPFIMDEMKGLTKQEVKGGNRNPQVETVKVSGPFKVLGACRNPNGHEWGKLISFRDADSREHILHLAEAELQGDPAALCAKLAGEGLRINREHQRKLSEYISSVSIYARVTHVERTGWHKIGGSHAFVMPGAPIAASDLDERVILSSTAHGPYAANGSLEDWQAGVGALSADHSWARFAISVALSGPLAELVNGESGGFSFYGPSSIGKSSLLCAGASVWGRGSAKEGYVRSWRSTANGLEGAAASANDTCLVLDELGVGEARDIAAAIYQLGNGVGKVRSNRDGSARDPKSWSVIILSSGEVPIDVKIEEERGRKSRSGQTIRLLDLPADRALGFGVFDGTGGFDKTGQLADALKEAASTAYGTAGPAFVRALLEEDRTELAELAKNRMAQFVEKVVPKGASEQIGRAAKRFALAALAGELATALAITPWGQSSARQAAVEAFEAWLAKRGGAGSHEERQAVENVRRLIVQHGDSRFEMLSDVEKNVGMERVHNRLGWHKGEGIEREWWIFPEIWKTEVCNGLDPVYVARTLAAKGMLRRQNGRDLTCVVAIGQRRPRAYVVTSRILDDET